MTQSYRLQHLFQKFLRNDCTKQDLEELIGLLNEMENDELDVPMKALWEKSKDSQQGHQVDWQKMYGEIMACEESLVTIHQIKRRNFRRLWINTAAAASIIIAVTAGGYFILNKELPKQKTAQLITNDIAPGRNQATLTLANGQKITLKKGLKGGILALQGQTRIQVNQSGIVYRASKSEETVSYNTLSTARGEQSPYPLILADGSKVWLNSQSSVTFPTAFNQKDRVVKLTGEAYFEVKHNARQPFKVETANQTIEDLGTSFDVNAYSDEPNAKTTLIEGSIKVDNVTLKPGQQSDGQKVKEVDTERFIAWKNGDFDFEGDNIQTIMLELSRWYNIDVRYQGAPLNTGFSAEISRSKNIGAVLHMLERTKLVHFKIEERRVTVIK